MVNVIVSGAGGFLFWILAARKASTSAVAEASALITAMIGVLQITQQMLIANLPVMITASPRPARLLKQTYLLSTVFVLAGATIYIAVAPRLASGMEYLNGGRLAVAFIVGTTMWGIFGLQDAALSGIVKGHLVLAENTAWSVLRLLMVMLLPLAVGTLSTGWILATWLIPALALVIAVNYYLLGPKDAPLRKPRGNHVHERRKLLGHLGFETLTAAGNGGINVILPAIVLTAVGSDAAAPFFAAHTFILVAESALGSFAAAYAVEIRRHGRVDRKQTSLTVLVLGGCSVGAIAASLVFGRTFMGLLGADYRDAGGTALILLTLGLPFRAITLLSGAVNRVLGDGWRNAVQQLAYVAVSLGAIALLGDADTDRLAIALVLGRVAAALVACVHLRTARSRGQAHVTLAAAGAHP